MTVVRRGGEGMDVAGLVKNNGSIATEQNSIFEDEPQGASEGRFLHLPPGLGQVLGGVRVVHRQDFLDNDRSLVEFFGDKERGGADDFHAALEGLRVRSR